MLEAEHSSLEPPVVTDLTGAAAALTTFGWFCEQEPDAAERNKILRAIFETVTVDDRQIVSVTAREAFLPHCQFGQTQTGGKERERRD